ncbi:hypothetical protein ABZ907_20820 [Nonomuraea wenchangensis]
MASIRHEIVIDASPEHSWDVLRDVGAVHERLLPGRVIDTRLEGDQRFLTFPDGHVIRELVGRAAAHASRRDPRTRRTRRTGDEAGDRVLSTELSHLPGD